MFNIHWTHLNQGMSMLTFSTLKFCSLIFSSFGCGESSLLHAGFLQLQGMGTTFSCGCKLLIAVASLLAGHPRL